MKRNSRARRRTNTLLLIGTFGMGIALGFTLCITFVAIAGLNFSGTPAPVPTTAETPTTVASIPPAEPDTPPPTDPIGIVLNEAEGEEELVVVQEEGEHGTTTEETATPIATMPASMPDDFQTRFADVGGLWPARHIIIGINGTSLDEGTTALIRTFKPGGIILEDHNFETPMQARTLILDIKNAAGFGRLGSDVPLIMVGQDGGAIGNPLKARPAPTPAELAAVGDLEEVVSTAEHYAGVAAELGVAVFLAPTLNVFRQGQSNPEFATQSFGGDPEPLTYFGIAFAEGVLNKGLIPVAKHYPGIGTGHIDNTGLYVVKEAGERALAELMYPFAEVAARNIPGILVGHVAVPALETANPPPPASVSKKLIGEVLRELWGYDGVVIADDFTLHPAVSDRPVAETVVMSLAAGADAAILLQVGAVELEAVCEAITNAVIAGTITPEALANSKSRLDVWHTSLAQNLGATVSHPTPPPVVRPGAIPPPAESAPAELPETRTQVIKHRIEQGESLNSIANKYGVSTQDLMKWNNLKDANIRYGYSLIVNAPVTGEEPAEAQEPETAVEVPEVEKAAEPENAAEEAPAELETPAEPEPLPDEPTEETPSTEPTPSPTEEAEPAEDPGIEETAEPETPEEETATTDTEKAGVEPESLETETTEIGETAGEDTGVDSPEQDTPAEEEPIVVSSENAELKTFLYEIKPGDNLTLIANKYGATITDIQRWNNMTDSKILVGLKLKIQTTPDKLPEGAEIVPNPPANAAEKAPEPMPTPEEKVMEPPQTDNTAPETEPGQEMPAESTGNTPPAETPSGNTPEEETEEEETTPLQPEVETPEPAVTEANVEKAALEVPTPASDDTAQTEVVTEPETEPAAPDTAPVAEPTPQTSAPTTRYRVQPGDTLFKISRQFNAPVNKIMEWNNLKDGNIKSGTYLTIHANAAPQAVAAPTPTQPEPQPEPEPTLTQPEPTENDILGEGEEEAPAPAPTAAPQPPGTIKYTHTVRIEQTLEGIATAYDVSPEDILKWNALTSHEIAEGQQLTIYMRE